MALQSDTLHQFCTVGEMSQPDAIGGSSLRGGFFFSPPDARSLFLVRGLQNTACFQSLPPTRQGGDFSFSFSSSRSLRLTGRRGTVGRRVIICSFSHTADRSHFLQSALSLRYSSTIFDQKWIKDQDWHSLFDVWCLRDRASLIQEYKQPTRCNSNNLLIISISSTCFGR